VRAPGKVYDDFDIRQQLRPAGESREVSGDDCLNGCASAGIGMPHRTAKLMAALRENRTDTPANEPVRPGDEDG
jgi:hypothetical protein